MAAVTGWQADLALDLAPRAGRTALVRKRQKGPLTVQRAFYPEPPRCHLYLLHPPGGVVGGDQLRLAVSAASGAQAVLTAPGASKFYRSAGPGATLRQCLSVEDGGVLEWLPPEVILFPGARVSSQTRIMLRGRARFIGWDVLSLGLPFSGDRFDQGQADLEQRIERDGRPLLSERLRIGVGEPCAASLDGPTRLRGRPVVASLVAVGAAADDLTAARGVVDEASGLWLGITLIDDLLVVRCLAERVEPAFRQFRALWRVLRPRLLGVEPCPPRIWAT